MKIWIKATAAGAIASGKAPLIVQSNLDAAITEATLFLDAKVKAGTPQGVGGAQGGLLGSIQNEVQSKGTPIVKGIIMSAHPYAEVIEKGRKPGKGVPKGVLTPWIQKKLGITGEKELASVEFLIRRKIKVKGFKGSHMFEKAPADNWGAVQGIFNRYGLNITKELSE